MQKGPDRFDSKFQEILILLPNLNVSKRPYPSHALSRSVYLGQGWGEGPQICSQHTGTLHSQTVLKLNSPPAPHHTQRQRSLDSTAHSKCDTAPHCQDGAEMKGATHTESSDNIGAQKKLDISQVDADTLPIPCVSQQGTNRRNNPIGYNISNLVFQIPNWGYFILLGIGDLFCDSALPDSYIPNPQLDMLCPIGGLRSPFGDNIHKWG